ncbi:YHS domain-containing (seleno)protein [Planktotalea arctica]|uniref:YHS domain-containing (seleno)protein n=1 Tax=Planktotalea arctica TaxID=1481893 RepID=UPI0032192120
MIFSRRKIIALGIATVAMPAFASTEPRWYDTGSGLAASGRDVVAYFSLSGGDGVMGSDAFSVMHKGTMFHFANAENLTTFSADPDKYAPHYGGYCAFAMSRGYFASGDPDAWSVHEGALYLNVSKAIRARWALRRAANIEAGDENWQGFFPGER